MTHQKHSNPLKDPELPARFARLLAKYMIKARKSDEQLRDKMNEVAGASGSLATIRRHKDGTGGIPTYRMIGIYQEALGIPANEIDLLIDPDRGASLAGAPSFSDLNEQWQQLVEYLRRQSQLPHYIQEERALADAAVKQRNYDKARRHLEKVSEWTRDSYHEHENSLAYATEEYGRALAGLGALAFTSMDFAEARAKYLEALSLPNLPPERRHRYQHSYLVSSTALAARSGSETEARAILKEMADNGVTPSEVTVSTAIKKCNTFEDALGLVDFCLGKNFFVGRGSFEAAFSKSITHLTADQLLSEYHARKFKFDTALEGPINQYRRADRLDQALILILFAPHLGAAQKLYRERYIPCRAFFQAQLAAGNDEDNVYYALGIAAALNGDWEIAKPNLQVALERSYASKRGDHIKNLLSGSSLVTKEP